MQAWGHDIGCVRLVESDGEGYRIVRVLSSEDARSAITQMQSIISGGLVDQIKSLDAQGQRLMDPNVWDGKLATDFRSTWPATNQTLDTMVLQLEELRTKIQAINADIMTAGGNA